eukprot:scaffold16351_cov64-Attheya_sp.AAC.1
MADFPGANDVSMFEIVKSRVQSKPDVPLHKMRDQPGKPYTSHICLGCGQKQRDTININNISNNTSKIFMTCARCKAVKYCCRDCQVLDWKGKGSGPTKPRKHKDICAELQEAIQEFQSHPTAGPFLRTRVFQKWADQHHPEDGTFHMHEFLARKKLLGGAKVGFWAIPDVLTPYHTAGKDRRGFQNGQMLLKEDFPSMIEGWTTALDKTERVDVTQPPPNPLPAGGIKGWEDYVKLRNLSPTSVAPLLMTNVLSIYQMIQHELELLALGSSLKVYVLAVEAELNQIPLLQELLYLLPGVDLELIYLSPAAKAICDEAKDKPCLLTRRNFTVLDVQEGTGRLRVKLDPDYGHYDEVAHDIVPDAVLGLNAGLGSYSAWAPTLHKIIRMGTPFCFSDQTKLIHRFTETNWLPISVVRTINNAFPNYRQLQMPDVTIQLNPFHGIVGRDVAYVLAPNISNGYLITAFPE